MKTTLLLLALLVPVAMADYFFYPYKPDPKVQLSMSVVKLQIAPDSGGGTGFVTKAKSGKPVTVTNQHVCVGSETKDKNGDYLIASRLGEFEDVKAKILDKDEKLDLCILEGVPGYPLEIGSLPSKFQELLAVGHPSLMEQTPVRGDYTGENTVNIPLPGIGVCPPGTTPVVSMFGLACILKFVVGDTTMRIFPGNSGSPVVDSNGKLVGVMDSMDTRTGWGSFIPVRFLKDYLEKF